MSRGVVRQISSPMNISFDVAGLPAQFRRNLVTGEVQLEADGKVIRLQSPWNLRAHFSWSHTRTWRQKLGDHEVVIEQKRRLWLAGLRPISSRPGGWHPDSGGNRQ